MLVVEYCSKLCIQVQLTLIHSEYQGSYIGFYHDPCIPWTNNRIEQINGRLKNSAKHVRGYKTTDDLLAAAWLPANSGHKTVYTPWGSMSRYLLKISPTSFVTDTDMHCT